MLGGLYLEKAYKAIFYKFVYKSLFTLGHVTKFVYKSNDKYYTRRFMPWKGLQGDFWRNPWTTLRKFQKIPKNSEKVMTRITLGDLCLEKAYKAIFDKSFNNTTVQQQFKFLEGAQQYCSP